MPKRYSFVISSVVLFASVFTFGQNKDHWEDYEPRTLQSIIEMHRGNIVDLNSRKKAILLTGDSFPSKVELVYAGESRPVSKPDKMLLSFWRKMLGNNAPPEDAFPKEFLFGEGSEKYWIVAQKPLIDALPKELKVGNVLTAYIVWIGAIKVDEQWEWLFAMNEFESSN
jgi:hypothetical protein